MKQNCRMRRGLARGILLLLPGLLVGSDLTLRAADGPSFEPGRGLSPSARAAPAGEVGPEALPEASPKAGQVVQQHPPRQETGLKRAAVDGREPSPGLQEPQLQPSRDSAPDVEVRVGDHGAFTRVVFEWPEPIAYDVAHRAQEVVIGFPRGGRIDLSRLKGGFGGRVLGARADGDDASGQVVLRVPPDAGIRAFGLENDRLVVVDVLGEPARNMASPTPGSAPHGVARATERALERPAIDPPRSEVDHARVDPTSDAPEVEVRVGDHGGYQRVVFEWPERVEHEVRQHGEQVTIAFSRTGRIDFSGVKERLRGRVLEARAVGPDATERVALRVLPGASIRSFRLAEDRIVVVDVFGGLGRQVAVGDVPNPASDPVAELKRELEERDDVIENLLARVEQLERGAVLSGGDLDRIVAGQATSPGAASLPPAVAAAEPPAGPRASGQESAASGEDQGAGASAARTQPGQLQVDEEEIDRALERTLVQAGVLLLPVGQAETEPFFSYTRREADSSMVVFADDGLSVGAQVDVRRNEFVSGQELRFGMPFDSQVEFGFPYRLVDQSMVATVDMGGSREVDHVGHGMGDMSIGVAKTLVRENGHWWPDLVGRVTWDTATGKTTSNDVALGGGFNELRGSLSAVKRQDPLAFVGGVSYETTFEKDDIKPGDQLGISIGTILAASPGTSLRLGLDQRFTDTTKSNGEGIDGSDSVVATATLGASVVLGRGMLLDVAADIGLTDDAPAYAARASLPIRFNLPVY